MDTTKAQQKGLDDALVAPENCLKIGKCNQRLSRTLKSNQPTIHVALDALKLTPFYNAFKIFPKLPGQKFEDPPFEEEILSLIRDLGHTGEIKVLSDVNVNHLHQPWRSFAAIINKCLSGKTTTLESVCLSRAQIPKGVIPAKKKQSATKSKGLMVLSEVSLTEAEQMKIALERSKIQTHSSHASGLGADEGTGITPGVPDVPTYEFDAEQISWKSSDEEDDDEAGMHDDNDDDTKNQDDDDQEHDDQDDEEQYDVNELTDSDNDGDDFVHPKLSTHDKEDKEEEDLDPMVHTPSNYESTDVEESDEEIQGANVEGEEMNEEETNQDDKANELYRDMNINLEGRDTEMTDAPRTIVKTTQVIEDTHVIITPVNLEAQQQSSFVSSGFISNKLNPSPDTVSSILGIVDAYLANKMHEAVKTAVQLQSDRLRDEAQAKNAEFINKLDDNIKKIIKDQVKEQVKAQVSKILPKIKKTVNEQLEAEVLTRSSNKSKTSHAVAANLSKLELKKILIDKMESDKRRDEEDKDEEPSAGSKWGSKRRRAGKEPKSTSAPKEKTSNTTGKSTEGSKSNQKSANESAQAEEPMQIAKDLQEPAHQEFETGVTKDQPDEETSQLLD
ncbi:hypothetical protein Tco_0324603 [Tanacetum coccineum]